ncbi:MAG: hypothetical protein NT086_11260 [Proteobacteria bacterium]|nr:hypothetical protein [Pseudomonadota bacterium]
MNHAYIRAGRVDHIAETPDEEMAGLECTVALADDSKVKLGDLYDGSAFHPPLPPPIAALTLSPIEFKLLFHPNERVAIKQLRATDPMVEDFMSIVEDPRITHIDLSLQSTRYALAYLEEKGLITATRLQQILTGVVQ